MQALLISLVYGTILFFIYSMFFMDEGSTADRAVVKRLKATKDKKYAIRNEEDIFKKLEARRRQNASLVEILRDSAEYRIYYLELLFKRFGFMERIKTLLKMADVKTPVDVFLMTIAGIFFPFLLLALFKVSILFLLFGVAAAAAPFMFLKMKISKNLQNFSQLFPDALALIANSLRAGHSLLASFQLVAVESAYPVNKLFKTVADDISLGKDVREALEDMINIMPQSDDLRFFITAVLIQKEIGGNLSEILDTLNNTIRERIKLLGMIKTQTSQAKISGIVLALAPVFIAGLVSLLNPTYMAPLFNEFAGQCALALALLMSGFGFFIISMITNIRV